MNAREYALNVLEKVYLDHGFAGLLMRGKNDLSRVDQAFVSQLVYGTIRNTTLLEHQWKPLVQKRVKKKTCIVLNMALYQMFFMDKVPMYAAISSAVDLVDRHEKGFVNAILHKAAQAGLQKPEDTFENAWLNTSHPKWLLQLWKAHYGEENAWKIAKSNQQPSRLYGRVNTLKTTKERLEQTGKFHFVNDISCTCDELLSASFEFQSGQIVIQDIHSAMVAQALDARQGERVLDVCSAPGTKTQQIAMMMENKGEIIACDLYEHRIALVNQLMERTGVSIVKTMVRDETEKNSFSEEYFDRILIDAPCSGLGDLSGKPEIRLHVTPENLDEIQRTQKAILDANLPYLKKGGTLVYSTCTLNRKENEGMVQKILKQNPSFSLVKEKTLFPFEEDGDGFYLAVLVRN